MELNFQNDSKGSAVQSDPTTSTAFKDFGAKFKNLSLQTAVSLNNFAKKVSVNVNRPSGLEPSQRHVSNQHELHNEVPISNSPFDSKLLNQTPDPSSKFSFKNLSLQPALSFPNLDIFPPQA